MNKFIFTLVALLCYQILPLLAAPHLLVHWKMLAIIAAAATLWLSQPAVQSNEAATHQKSDRHTIWLILAMAGVATIAPEIEWAYGRTEHRGSWVWNALGLGMMTGGIVFRVWAIQTLGRFFTATVQTTDEQVLLQSGPYAWLRHPSYLGAYIAILGCAVLLQAWMGSIVSLLAMSHAYYRRIRTEEDEGHR